ncbi:hypothetical protein BDR07DRAFT_629705 [Suillus spraguei]|nr:hypothetical protein BDR07DRAFT_629705 [Suillus spraguei]
MYYREPDTIIISHCLRDFDGDISKELMEMSQPLDLPDDWKMPSQPLARFCFSQLLLITLGKPDLEGLWQDVSQWNRLDERFEYMCNLIVGLSTITCVLFVHAACVLILEYSIQTADRSSEEALEDISTSLLLVSVSCRGISWANSGYMIAKRGVWETRQGGGLG